MILPFVCGCAAALFPSAEQRFGQIWPRCDEEPGQARQGDLVVMTGCGKTSYLLEFSCRNGERTCYDDVTRAVESFSFAHECELTAIEGTALGSSGRVSLGLSGCGQRASYQAISGSGWVLEGSSAQAAAEQAKKRADAEAAAAAAAKSSE